MTRLRAWQFITLATLFIGYCGYYVCRSNLSVVGTQLRSATGLSKEEFGLIGSAGIVAYSLGKFSNGLLGDWLGGRRLFLLGMAVSIGCTFAFPLGGTLGFFICVWMINRYVQSMGWPALVQLSARWYPPAVHASAMAVLSVSYLVGDAAARWYLGRVMEAGADWRGVFQAAAAVLAIIFVVSLFTLKPGPAAIGEPETIDPPTVVYDEPTARFSIRGQLVPLLASVDFWLVCLINIGLTLIRESFNYWSPTFLEEAFALESKHAAGHSAWFPAIGAVSVIVAGPLGDWLGTRGRILGPSTLLLTAALAWLTWWPPTDLTGGLVLVGLVFFFLLGPYSYCSGVMALDFGGRRGGSTATGIIDFAGYGGAVLSGVGIGTLVDRFGWGTAFGSLTATAGLTAVAALIFWIREERWRWAG